MAPKAIGPWRYSKTGVVTVDLVPLAASPHALINRLDREYFSSFIAAMGACNTRRVRGAAVRGRPDFEGLSPEVRRYMVEGMATPPRWRGGG